MGKGVENASIQAKLKKSFATVGICLAIMLVAFVIGILVMGLRITRFYHENYEVVMIQGDMQSEIGKISENMLLACITQDKDSIQEYVDKAEERINILKTLTDDISVNYIDKNGYIDKFVSELSDAEQSKTVVDIALGNSKQDEAMKVYEERFMPALDKAKATLNLISTDVKTTGVKKYYVAFYTGLISMIVGGIIFIFSFRSAMKKGSVLAKHIVVPVKEIVDGVNGMTKGSLNINIEYQGDDELGEMAENMRNYSKNVNAIMQDLTEYLSALANGDFTASSKNTDIYIGDYAPILDNLQVITQKFKEAMKKIKETTNQVTAGASNMATGATALAEGATEQSKTIDELSVSIDEVTDKAKKTKEQSEKAYKLALNVGEEIEISNRHMMSMTQAMERINQTSSKIEQVIQNIEDIAAQTNLLSLNAAIEAARAGEAGKGFAVVADEIRQLADQSALSANNTRELIHSSVAEIEEGNKILKDTSDSLSKVVESIGYIGIMANESMSASKEQFVAIEEVDKGIREIAEVVEGNSATAQESSASSEELYAQVEVLMELISEFKTE